MINKTLLILAICASFSSCTVYYFSEPQPIDTKNIYKVPKKLTGSWYINSDNKKGGNEVDSLVIGETFYSRITKSMVKEPKDTIDLDSNIYCINNKIYSNKTGKLEGGFNYQVIGDSIAIDVVENETVELGKKAFLRKIEHGYILNLNHKNMNDWWEIRYIDTRNKESIIIRELGADDLKQNNNHQILHDDFDNYIVAQWSREQIQEFINNGGFSDTTLVLKQSEKLKD